MRQVVNAWLADDIEIVQHIYNALSSPSFALEIKPGFSRLALRNVDCHKIHLVMFEHMKI